MVFPDERTPVQPGAYPGPVGHCLSRDGPQGALWVAIRVFDAVVGVFL